MWTAVSHGTLVVPVVVLLLVLSWHAGRTAASAEASSWTAEARRTAAEAARTSATAEATRSWKPAASEAAAAAPVRSIKAAAAAEASWWAAGWESAHGSHGTAAATHETPHGTTEASSIWETSWAAHSWTAHSWPTHSWTAHSWTAHSWPAHSSRASHAKPRTIHTFSARKKVFLSYELRLIFCLCF
jgi:hypothetical protein